MNFLSLFLCAIVGYLIGSIPNALIIGKYFYKKDIREFGSHNLGGTNAGRVLGPKAGVSVIVLDILKMAISIVIAFFMCKAFKIEDATLYLGVASIMSAIGHCYPIYCGFKGGKAVSVVAGFLLITNPILLLIWGAIFFLTLKIKKMVSLGSMLASILTSILMFIPIWDKIMLPYISYNIYYPITFTLLTLLLIYRHIPNIKRIMNHTESKIKWMDHKK